MDGAHSGAATRHNFIEIETFFFVSVLGAFSVPFHSHLHTNANDIVNGFVSNAKMSAKQQRATHYYEAIQITTVHVNRKHTVNTYRRHRGSAGGEGERETCVCVIVFFIFEEKIKLKAKINLQSGTRSNLPNMEWSPCP